VFSDEAAEMLPPLLLPRATRLLSSLDDKVLLDVDIIVSCMR